MDEAIDLARQKRLPFRVNRGQVIDKTISVNNANGTQYNFTGHTAEMYVYNSFNKTDTPEYTIAVTLALGSMTFSHAAITRKKENHVYKLWMTDASGYRQIWTNGDFLILDSEVDHEDGEETIVISPDGDSITLTISPTGVNHYRGLYVSLPALQAAIPTGNPGDYADVDAGVGTDVQRYIWDNDDADWVAGSSGGGTTETASNGLTKTVNDIRLGGPLTEDTTITGNFDLNVGTTANPIDNFLLRARPDGGNVNIGWIDNSTLDYAAFETQSPDGLGGGFVAMVVRSSGREVELELNPELERALISTGNWATFKGLEYGADHSANYSTRSLVDKAYVDAGTYAKYKVLYKNNVSSSLTGTVSETIMDSFLLPANTLQENDVLLFTAIFTKSGTGGVSTGKFRHSTPAADLSGSSLGQLNSGLSTTTYNQMERKMFLKNSLTSQEIYAIGSNVNTDLQSSATTISSLSINFGANQYLMFTITLANAADTVTLRSWMVELLRA